MIHVLPFDADNVLAVHIAGKLESADLDEVAKQVDRKLAKHEKLRIFAEVEHLEGIALNALLKDLKLSLQHLRDFEKEAIVSDEAWLARLAAIGDRLFPSIEVRHFTWKERVDAVKWVCE